MVGLRFAPTHPTLAPYMTRTLFMINGIVDNHLWTHESNISRQYPLSNIKQIEVLYGPASAVYGPNAFLGIINIITNDGTKVKDGEIDGTVNVLMGSYKNVKNVISVKVFQIQKMICPK